MLDDLKLQVYEANMDLVNFNLVTFTWGNVSAIDRESGYVVIKPSGVKYDVLTPDDMVVVDLKGNIIEGSLKPSSDMPTHLCLYNSYNQIGAVTHTHSTWAVACAQAGVTILPLGTTHADYFYGKIPCTRNMTEQEIKGNYEYETGKVIVEALADKDPMHMKAVLVKSHGPFTWGKTAKEAVEYSVILEEVARMFILTKTLTPNINTMDKNLLDKHFMRKHGKDAYYGQ